MSKRLLAAGVVVVVATVGLITGETPASAGPVADSCEILVPILVGGGRQDECQPVRAIEDNAEETRDDAEDEAQKQLVERECSHGVGAVFGEPIFDTWGITGFITSECDWPGTIGQSVSVSSPTHGSVPPASSGEGGCTLCEGVSTFTASPIQVVEDASGLACAEVVGFAYTSGDEQWGPGTAFVCNR